MVTDPVPHDGLPHEDGSGPDETQVRLTAWVEGRVQGVGFRWWVRAQALELGLAGSAENLDDGRVMVIAQGAQDRCRELLLRLEGGATPGRVSRISHRWSPSAGQISGFIER
jgi:acylphosphatase